MPYQVSDTVTHFLADFEKQIESQSLTDANFYALLPSTSGKWLT